MSGPSKPTQLWSSWLNRWTLFGLPGACAAVLGWGWGATLAIAASVAIPLTLILLLIGLDGGRWDGAASGRRGPGRIGRVVLCGVALALLLNAAGTVAPGLALLIAVAALGTAPPIVVTWRRLLTGAEPPHVHSPPTAETGPQRAAHPRLEMSSRTTLRSTSDAELCRAWQHSFWCLREATRAEDKVDIVVQRQRLLDELEERHAPQLQSWLASGGRAHDSPHRFLPDNGGERPTTA
jgi:hypothetical protein